MQIYVPMTGRVSAIKNVAPTVVVMYVKILHQVNVTISLYYI